MNLSITYYCRCFLVNILIGKCCFFCLVDCLNRTILDNKLEIVSLDGLDDCIDHFDGVSVSNFFKEC